MKPILLLLAGALIPGPMLAYDVQGNSIILNDAEVRQCVEQGGCRLVTRAWMEEQFKLAREAGCKGSI